MKPRPVNPNHPRYDVTYVSTARGPAIVMQKIIYSARFPTTRRDRIFGIEQLPMECLWKVLNRDGREPDYAKSRLYYRQPPHEIHRGILYDGPPPATLSRVYLHIRDGNARASGALEVDLKNTKKACIEGCIPGECWEDDAHMLRNEFLVNSIEGTFRYQGYKPQIIFDVSSEINDVWNHSAERIRNVLRGILLE
jgi:hypothetical protein